jgi:signal peptidase II
MSALRARDLFTLVVGLVVIIVDQLTKAWIVNYFGVVGGRPPIPILGQYLTLQYLQNTGVAFSMFSNSDIKFILIVIALGVVCYMYWRFRASASLWLLLGFALVIGGAVGNLLDRITHKYVVDFIYFQIPQDNFSFAVFNMADSAISIGVILIAVTLYLTRETFLAPAEPPTSYSSSVKALKDDSEPTAESSAQAGAGERP